jgi:hypothetical protein
MRKRGIGKIDTNTLLLIGVGAVAVYMLTRPAVPTLPAYNPYAVNPLGGSVLSTLPGNYVGNSTAQDIAASGTALDGLSSLIGNFF